jgi:uncharacterized OB-fold protein
MGLSERVATNAECGRWEGSFPLEHLYTVGVAGERVLRELEAEGRLLGSRCTACQVTYAPARQYCERCLARLNEWVDIPLIGTLASYTVVHRDVDGRRLDPPQLVGLIALDGADGVFLHRLGGAPPEWWHLGRRVTGLMLPESERVGSINDIAYFGPAG